MRSRAIFLLLPSLLVACDDGEGTDLTDVYDRLDALEAEVEDLETDHAAHEAIITSQAQTIASLEEEVNALNGAVDLTALSANVSQNSDEIASISSDYLTSTDLSGYASSEDVFDNAAAIAAVAADYITSTDLTGYATETWVSGQAYGAASDISANAAGISSNVTGIATNASDISAIASNYLTSTNLTGLASESYVDAAIADIDNSAYLTSTDLSGYATESWVSGQDFGYAADIATNVDDIATNADNIDSMSGGVNVGPIIYGDYTIENTLDIELLDGVEEITGDLLIDNSDYLTDLDGLDSLTTIGGSLTIYDNDSLTNLYGLSGLETVGQDLMIIYNDSICTGVVIVYVSTLTIGGSTSYYDNDDSC